MYFILCTNIVYIEKDPEFQNNWKKWSEWTITFCRDYHDRHWPESLRANPPHKETLKDNFLKMVFLYAALKEAEDRKDMDLFQHLCDFVFCLNKGVEIKK